MERIRYYSTNRRLKTKSIQGYKKTVSFKEAIFGSMAPDTGLYMPTMIPQFSKKEILDMKTKSYPEIAYRVLKKFLHKEIKNTDLKKIIKKAFNFKIPIEKLDEKTYIVKLDQGPTASFKDFAAQLMARLTYHLKPKNKNIIILVATSGDTGSAIGEAYRGLKGIKVYIIYPQDEVTPLQKNHMDSVGKNVKAISLYGKFDDCQSLVKKALLDPELKKLNLMAANSINIGRILPQITYYFYSYLKTTKDFEKIIFSIPSGNFGNSLGCEIARRMGLPIKKIIIAVNENDEFPVFLEKSKYRKIEPSKACISNAMNVGNPSNLARYFDFYNGTIDKNGKIHKMPNIKKMKNNLFSVSITDKETRIAIKKTYKNHNTIIEPHGAVGIAALEKYRKKNKKTLALCIETADPAKFSETILQVLKIKPKIPNSLKTIYKRKGKPHKSKNNFEDLKIYLQKNN